MAEEVLVYPLASVMSLATLHEAPVTVTAGKGHTLLLTPEVLQVSGLEAEWPFRRYYWHITRMHQTYIMEGL